MESRFVYCICSPLQAYTPSTAETPLPPLQLQYSAEQRSPASSTATPTYLDNSVASAATPALNTTVSALDVTVDGSPQVWEDVDQGSDTNWRETYSSVSLTKWCTPCSVLGLITNTLVVQVSTEPTQYKALSMWKGLQEHVKNIKTTCKRRRFKKYKSAVSGREITSHVHEYLLTRPEEKYSRANRGQAEQVAEMLYKQGLIISAHGSKCIRDSKVTRIHFC